MACSFDLKAWEWELIALLIFVRDFANWKMEQQLKEIELIHCMIEVVEQIKVGLLNNEFNLA